MQKYILCLFMFLGCTDAWAQNGNLPNNPWNIQKHSINSENTIKQEVVRVEKSTTDLPQNPWAAVQNTDRQPIGEKVNYHNHRNQTAMVESSENQEQQHRVRQVGGVGKIGYAHTSRATTTENDDNLSSFDGLWDNQPSFPTIPETSSGGSLNYDTDFNSGYEKLKQKSVNQWHRLTSPITDTVQRWFNAAKQTGEDLLK